jgi:hypothetical protein
VPSPIGGRIGALLQDILTRIINVHWHKKEEDLAVEFYDGAT